ncbi:hypothetical protein TBLA_0D04420 [Henningerozyma blattae CBS 6284]|uniref:non-specific serine/threonine protein kinase n=1 Tax=Henningerozyma blattae (strain ATCC 34711 / CBS 6284 / DSM 70876 / NBRC 10599 / NRRL Y-10934 / UCD 77-7) TaxID=1071380 RepID=I2H3I6_HENB6|nr:hypothetical protein TBLA_0D04420 [Tetrapisispora blattae CBS 6284]CCH60938.1 hypothetical protein TBLA_0D04420 [Tetrapisispora blattae CBS 6284]
MNKLKNWLSKKKSIDDEESHHTTTIENSNTNTNTHSKVTNPIKPHQSKPVKKKVQKDLHHTTMSNTQEESIYVLSETSTATSLSPIPHSTNSNLTAINTANNATTNTTVVNDVVSSPSASSIPSPSPSPSSSASLSFSLPEEMPDRLYTEQLELNGFKLINKIGTGAFSTVFRAIPLRSNTIVLKQNYKEVAIKCIKKNDLIVTENNESNTTTPSAAAAKSSSRQQVLKEVTLQKMVSQCNNIVKFIDFQESSNYYYIVQELLNGGEIFGEIVRLTYFSEDLCRHVITQLAISVKYLHSMGVVHRDIKPENLLFQQIEYSPLSQQDFKATLRKSDDPTTKKDEGKFIYGVGGGGIGIVKLADFGLSKQIYSTNTKTPCGTVGYTAPEVVKDERYSMKVDMWGVGCVLYTMLCGFPPFYDERIDILTEKIANGEYTFLKPWWDEISDGAKNAVRRLLEVDPNKRYDVDEFLNDPWLKNYDCFTEQERQQNDNLDIIRAISNISTSISNVHIQENNNFASSKIDQESTQPISTKNPYEKDDETATHHKKNNTIPVDQKQKLAFLQRDSALLYSPAAVAMRDAFDISNAVQRQEEEKVNNTATNTPTSKNGNFQLDSLLENEEYSASPSSSCVSITHSNDVFQLSLDSSTIVKRRKDKTRTGISLNNTPSKLSHVTTAPIIKD